MITKPPNSREEQQTSISKADECHEFATNVLPRECITRQAFIVILLCFLLHIFGQTSTQTFREQNQINENFTRSLRHKDAGVYILCDDVTKNVSHDMLWL